MMACTQMAQHLAARKGPCSVREGGIERATWPWPDMDGVYVFALLSDAPSRNRELRGSFESRYVCGTGMSDVASWLLAPSSGDPSAGELVLPVSNVEKFLVPSFGRIDCQVSTASGIIDRLGIAYASSG